MNKCEIFHMKSQVLACYLFQMMRFINDQMLIAGQQLMTGLHIRKELGVVRTITSASTCFVAGTMVEAFAEPRQDRPRQESESLATVSPEVSTSTAEIQLFIVAVSVIVSQTIICAAVIRSSLGVANSLLFILCSNFRRHK